MKSSDIFLGVVILILSAMVFFLKLENTKLAKTAEDYEQVLIYRNSQIDSFKNKYNQTVAEGYVAQVNSEKIIEDLSKEVFNLRKENERRIKEYLALYRVKQQVRIDSILVPYDSSDRKVDTGWVRAETVVIPPKPFYDSTDNYTVRGRVLLEGVSLDMVSVPDTVSLRLVEKSKGLFKGRETVAQVIHSNPLVRTDGIQSITLKQKKTFWEKIAKPLAFAAGIFIGTKL